MKVAVGADHAGFDLKSEVVAWLESQGHQVSDVGAHTMDPNDDYPDFAVAVADSILSGNTERGVVVCGSGVGASITANKIKGIRACLCHDTYTARQGVEHDNMNILCLGSRIVGTEVVRELVSAFISAEYTNEERHARRLNKVIEMENDFS